MPFVYFGGKKGLARYYPPPAENVIIEPFAGSAGYSLHWATPAHEVILIEKDPEIVALWRRLQSPDALADLCAIRIPNVGERCRIDPFLLLAQGGVGGNEKATAGPDREWVMTDRMARDWPAIHGRLLAALPLVRNWQVIEGDYAEAPDIRATWFIDPPYWVPPDSAGSRGDGYRHGASAIDFGALAEWCKARRGQTIVCEQDGATWLPFRPLRRMTTASGNGGRRLEVVWTRTPGSMIATPRARQAANEASARRSSRMRRA